MNALRVIVIEDLSCVGKCSLGVAIPILSVMNAEVVPLPTAVLSAHTGIPNYTFLDMTEQMKKILEHFNKLNFGFNAVYTGFMANEEQIKMTERFLWQCKKNVLKVVDPVMGDDGRLYSTYNKAMCDMMRKLCRSADVITPNLTEAALLLGEKYPKNVTSELIHEWLIRLSELGPRYTIITGVRLDEFSVNFAYDKLTKRDFFAKAPIVKTEFSGTGDIFASVLVGALINQFPINIALDVANDFVYSAMIYTAETGREPGEGVIFERILGSLALNTGR